ncbi:MAG: CHAT domain-containing protein [Cyanobacteria bacterium REEB67]|nr:CHAT domain-containing protein [Cyanobacteria bacterium REEB67]
MTDPDRKHLPRGHKKKTDPLGETSGAASDLVKDGLAGSPQNQIEVDDLATYAYESLLSGRFEDARDSLARAISMVDPKNLASRAVLLTYFGQSQRLLQEFEAGEASLGKAIELARKASLLACELQARLFLGEMLKDNGQMPEAAKQFDMAFQAANFLKDDTAIEVAAGNLGTIYLSLCQFELASDWFNTALTVAQSCNSGNAALWLGSLGLTMSELGQYEKSVNWYERAYLEAELFGDALTMSICRGSEGNVRFEQKQYETAVELFKQAKALAAPIDKRREGIWLGNLGVALSRLTRMDEAVVHIGEAIEVAKAIGDEQSLAAHLDSMADCYKMTGEPEKARPLYEEALELARKIRDRLGERIYLSNLGKLKADAGELTPAFEYFASACNLFDEQRSSIKSDDLKTSFANKGQELYRDVIATCLRMDKRVEALEYVGRAKSRALLDLLSNSPIDISDLADSGAGDVALGQLVNREAALRAQIAQLERVYWDGDGPSSSTDSAGSGSTRGAVMPQEDSTRLYGEWRDVLNQLRRRHPNYASLISASTLTFAEMKNLWSDRVLADDTCLIEFYFPKEYLLVSGITSASTTPTNHVILEDNVLETLREDLATFLEMSSTEGWEVPLSLCKRLYKRLLGPIIESLPPTVKRLVLVPHSSLYHLPFSALHDGTGFLCERFSVSYVPTVSLIPILSKQRHVAGKDGDGYLVSAISDYSATRTNGVVFSSRLRSAAGLEDLGYTIEEANSIASLGKGTAGGTTLITNEQVKESLPKMFGDYEVVHFAGHAVFNADEPLASGLVLADGSILSAASILEGSALRTSRGRLLVLSACQTGVNVVTDGGEILGLARALMYAGMPNLVLSLWEVADRSTADLMQDFHTFWQSGKLTIAEALRQAQLKAIAARQPIHAWAPFIHFGIE